MTCVFVVLLLLVGELATAQTKESILAEGDPTDMFVKKFRWGLSWNQYWGTIKGSDLNHDYFAKPCIGFNMRTEYYFIPAVGIGVGFGVQQRGAGILNVDNSGGAFTHPWENPKYDGDSTYRERLRFNTIEVPVTLLLRTPRDIVKGLRLSGAAGIVFVKPWEVYDIFMIVEDGYHQTTKVEKDYLSSDLGYQLSFGPDIDAGQSCVFQLHFVYTKGLRNVYNGSGDGRLVTYGFRVSWLF